MGVLLTKEQFDRECGYRVALSIMGNLHAQGLLTDKEYGQIEPILARKFSPVTEAARQQRMQKTTFLNWKKGSSLICHLAIASIAASAERNTAARSHVWVRRMRRRYGFAEPTALEEKHTAHLSRFPKRFCLI